MSAEEAMGAGPPDGGGAPFSGAGAVPMAPVDGGATALAPGMATAGLAGVPVSGTGALGEGALAMAGSDTGGCIEDATADGGTVEEGGSDGEAAS